VVLKRCQFSYLQGSILFNHFVNDLPMKMKAGSTVETLGTTCSLPMMVQYMQIQETI
jgi:hypothetical protein